LSTLRLALVFLRLGVLNELQYRVNFFVAAFQALLSVGVGIVVLTLVYSHTASLNGWNESELLVVLGVQLLLGGIVSTAIQPNMQQLTDDVQQGKLDFLLTKPADAQTLVSLRVVRIWQSVDVISGAIVVAVGASRVGAGLGAGRALGFVGLLLLGACLLYCFWLILATGSFWIVDMWFLQNLWEGVFQTGRWPIGIYPGWLRYSMTYLIPIGFAVTVPAQALTDRLQWTTVGIAIGFAVALAAFTRWFWRFGLRRYSGASA
jgi:ABC-2 type transport system permease protein